MNSLLMEQPSVALLRQIRKRADSDAQTLANRIALLRQEGERACKRLDETRMRAFELEHRPLKSNEHQAYLRMKMEDIQEKHRKNKTTREKGHVLLKDVRESLLERRRSNAKSVRDSLRSSQDNKREIDKIKMQQLCERVHHVKERTTGGEKSRMLEEARLQQFQRNREERAEKGQIEAHLHYCTTKRISEMEREEFELMQWLQAKQEEQRDAYEMLATIAENRRNCSMSFMRSTLS